MATKIIIPLICIAAVVAAAAVCALVFYTGRFRMPAGFTVTAHSGCMGLPDNSVEAMEAGVAAGAQIVEFDLNYTKDGVPVLSHNAPEGDCPPVTDAFAFLREHPDIKANVDVKSVDYLEKIPPLAEKYGVTDQIFFTGVGEDWVPAVREKCPGIPYYLNTTVPRAADIEALADKVEKLGAVGVNINFVHLTRRLTRVFHARGLLVSAWTVNVRPQARYVLAAGPDNVTSRKPDMIVSLLAE